MSITFCPFRNVSSTEPRASQEGRLINFLLAQYPGSLARPVINSSEPIRVEFGLHLVQLISLDEKDQILSTYVQKMHVSSELNASITRAKDVE